MKKSLVIVLVLALMVTLLAGCGQKEASTEPEDTAAKDGYRVAYIARAQADSFAAWLANAVRKKRQSTTTSNWTYLTDRRTTIRKTA
jgi:inositol transport system substrate-binding protein